MGVPFDRPCCLGLPEISPNVDRPDRAAPYRPLLPASLIGIRERDIRGPAVPTDIDDPQSAASLNRPRTTAP